ncbi:MAG: hypothetical protein A2583_05210 [Bdellovibrionales bacterium RIFOXYD1_FULL_53_11]|nr:MAG: hypothetical protein A2583_05210 [Bdellovibrionales bacterium RIFOXYD1_FULL_53_11]
MKSILVIFAVFFSIDLFAANKHAMSGFDTPDYAFLRILEEPANELMEFISRSSTRGEQGIASRMARISCKKDLCGFMVSKSGEALAFHEIEKINTPLIADWDRMYRPSRGAVNLSRIQTGDACLHVAVNISGAAAKFLFDFLNEKPGNEKPYDIHVAALKCSREPVSGVHECSFRVAENGKVAP